MSTQRKRLMECMWSYENVSKIACVLGEIDFWIQELQVVMLAFVHQPHVFLTVLLARHVCHGFWQRAAGSRAKDRARTA